MARRCASVASGRSHPVRGKKHRTTHATTPLRPKEKRHDHPGGYYCRNEFSTPRRSSSSPGSLDVCLLLSPHRRQKAQFGCGCPGRPRHRERPGRLRTYLGSASARPWLRLGSTVGSWSLDSPWKTLRLPWWFSKTGFQLWVYLGAASGLQIQHSFCPAPTSPPSGKKQSRF